MITHTSDSHQIQSQNKTKWKLQIFKNAQNSNFEILQATLYATHLLKLLNKMYEYEMDPNQNCRRYRADMRCGTDGQSETNISPNNFVVRRIWLHKMQM